MGDGVNVRTLEDLRQHFDFNEVTGYYVDHKLIEWLEDRYYDDVKQNIEALDDKAPDFAQKFCQVFGVEWKPSYVFNSDQKLAYERKEDLVKQTTTDPLALRHVKSLAMNQEELEILLTGGMREIYLLGDAEEGQSVFTIPVTFTKRSFIGVGGRVFVDFKKDGKKIPLHKVIACCVPASNQAMVTQLVNNEAFHYVEPRHRTSFLDTMWHLGEAIQQHRYVDVSYGRLKDRKIVKRRLKPLALLFSEYYFYLIAFIDDKDIEKIYESARDITPTIYRLDRIKTLNVEKETFHIPYNRRFQEGEFRKRVQFMYGGRLQRVTFTYTGYDIDAILDRLPTAKILSEDNGTCQLEAEVYGKGIEMWLRSQGKYVKDIKIVEL